MYACQDFTEKMKSFTMSKNAMWKKKKLTKLIVIEQHCMNRKEISLIQIRMVIRVALYSTSKCKKYRWMAQLTLFVIHID